MEVLGKLSQIVKAIKCKVTSQSIYLLSLTKPAVSICLHVEVGTEAKNRLLLLSNLFKLMIKTWKISRKDNKISSIVQGAFWCWNPVLAWSGDFEQFATSTESCGANCHYKVNIIVTVYFSHNLFTALNNVTSYIFFATFSTLTIYLCSW